MELNTQHSVRKALISTLLVIMLTSRNPVSIFSSYIDEHGRKEVTMGTKLKAPDFNDALKIANTITKSMRITHSFYELSQFNIRSTDFVLYRSEKGDTVLRLNSVTDIMGEPCELPVTDQNTYDILSGRFVKKDKDLLTESDLQKIVTAFLDVVAYLDS